MGVTISSSCVYDKIKNTNNYPLVITLPSGDRILLSAWEVEYIVPPLTDFDLPNYPMPKGVIFLPLDPECLDDGGLGLM